LYLFKSLLKQLDYAITDLYATIVSTLWIFVVKDLNLTSSELIIYLGSDSSHSLGVSTLESAYTSKSKVHGSARSGKNVTLAVICLIIALISSCIFFFWLSFFYSYEFKRWLNRFHTLFPLQSYQFLCQSTSALALVWNQCL